MGGQEFGKLAKYRHVITYSLSPYAQKPFAGYFSQGMPNLWRRFRSKVFIVSPPMIVAYLIYTWGTNTHAKLARKDPAQFANDQ
ncbi:cytochrome b-c1 complex subunit 8-like [Anneissia japonica]|uniref:cytochrome b-c1 complex subunit 8-like n=1 Tax=Anneissia japonica TaxID=1529436 RepID=UPI001425A5D3|nr:cytochrome b-c1 complex subunit 8-like [Anneissia japonica]